VKDQWPWRAGTERRKLRIGIFHKDFYPQAVAYQLAEVIELHDGPIE